mmetsp:Transcript_41050/g.64895  ORF Transcript_41050/g.64895 Transcript_41050/m.64895 type:complete len:95 (+) Transcript_41050:629-913(+)
MSQPSPTATFSLVTVVHMRWKSKDPTARQTQFGGENPSPSGGRPVVVLLSGHQTFVAQAALTSIPFTATTLCTLRSNPGTLRTTGNFDGSRRCT